MQPNEEKKDPTVADVEQEDKATEGKAEPKALRKVIIETDGNMARILSAEVAGNLELKAILEGLAKNIKFN